MKKKYYFDHLPKTGGTAIYTLLSEIFGHNQISPKLDCSYSEALLRHDHHALISAHTVFFPGDHLCPSRFHFTLLREPIDRLLSQYWYYRNDVTDQKRHHVSLAKCLDLDEYLCVKSATTGVNHNSQTYHYAQLLWDGHGELDGQRALEYAKCALEKFDLVGVYSQFNQFVDVLCFQCGWPFFKTIPRINVTSSRTTIQELSISTRAQIERLNELDMELYSFASSLFDGHQRNAMKSAISISQSRSPLTESFAELNGRNEILPLANYQPRDFGSKKVQIESVALQGAVSCGQSVLCDERITLSIHFIAHNSVENLTIGIQIVDENYIPIFGTNSRLLGNKIDIKKKGSYIATFSVTNRLGLGKYWIGAALHTGVSHMDECFHWKDQCTTFEVTANIGEHFEGRFKMHPTFFLQSQTKTGSMQLTDITSEFDPAQRIAIHTPILTTFSADISPVGTIPDFAIGEIISFPVLVKNSSKEVWRTSGQRPVRLSYHWLDSADNLRVYEGLRTEFDGPVYPGETKRVFMTILVPNEVGNLILALTLLQENVAWFDTYGFQPLRIPVTVHDKH